MRTGLLSYMSYYLLYIFNLFDNECIQVRLCGPKQRIAHFHPNWSNGSAGVRGTRILNGGRYYWEITVSKRLEFFL